MKRSGKCPKCGSQEIIADAQALDRGDANARYELSVATFRKPDAVILKQRQMSTVSAWVLRAVRLRRTLRGFARFTQIGEIIKHDRAQSYGTVRLVDVILFKLREAGLGIYL